jgi:hypothetical protein
MLTRDEVIQLIFYLIVATALLLATWARAESIKLDEYNARAPQCYSTERPVCVISDPSRRAC